MLWLVYLLELSGRTKPSGHNSSRPKRLASSSLWNAFGMVIEFRLVQPAKAPSPMLVTLSGMVIEVRLLHPEKAQPPMLGTPSGMVIEVRLLQ